MERPALPPIDWRDIYEEVKQRGRFEADAQLAESLGLTRAQISAWRTGKSELGTLVKLKLLDALGYDSLRSILHSLYPVHARDQHSERQMRLVERVGQTVQEPPFATRGIQALPSDGQLPWQSNAVLAVLSEAECGALQPYLAPVLFQAGPIVEGADDIYFPTTAVMSVVLTGEDCEFVPMASVGCEGCVGRRLFFGDGMLPMQILVEDEGYAVRMSADAFRAALRRSRALRHVYLDCARTVAAQVLERSLPPMAVSTSDRQAL